MSDLLTPAELEMMRTSSLRLWGVKPLREIGEEVEALRAFKAYVHKRLDDAGVATHPNGPHSKEGCRVGDRLDIIFEAAKR